MKNLKKLAPLFFLILFMSVDVSAQEQASAYNENSVYPIPYVNQMYKRTVWRRMDLEEKQNQPFFSTNNEITRIIINAVKDGILDVYEDDSLNKKMSKEKFLENLKLPEVEEDAGFGGGGDGFGGDSGWGDSGGGGGWGDESEESGSGISGPMYYDASELTILNIQEDMIFDKVRSRLYYNIQSIEIVIPAEAVATGIEKSVGVFRFKDLERLFRSMPERAIWYNRQNTAHHRNLADAFLLRLFNARVYKVSNPRNDQIADIYLDPKAALIKSQQIEHQLIEYEHNLWEY